MVLETKNNKEKINKEAFFNQTGITALPVPPLQIKNIQRSSLIYPIKIKKPYFLIKNTKKSHKLPNGVPK
jgi:hypothetical protein